MNKLPDDVLRRGNLVHEPLQLPLIRIHVLGQIAITILVRIAILTPLIITKVARTIPVHSEMSVPVAGRAVFRGREFSGEVEPAWRGRFDDIGGL
jgi:hypothetical protein